MPSIEGFGPPQPPVPFVGRTEELKWLAERLSPRQPRGYGQSLAIIGGAGVGKTALIASYIRRHSKNLNVAWFNCAEWNNKIPFRKVFEEFSWASRDEFYRSGNPGVTVVFDGADSLSEDKLLDMFLSARNRKMVETVVFTTRKEFGLRISHRDELRLTRLPELDLENLLREKLSLSDIDENSALRIMRVVNGHPQALSIVAAMAQSMSSAQLQHVLSGNIYDINDTPPDQRRALARSAKPVIISVNDDIIRRLKKEPKDVYKLTPRQYEELIADLLRDMGHEVTLTQATRDGGKDILATMKTDVGEILCLVDAKKYREDRKIGVGMVRTLYGTLTDYQASNAMLVTTSSYSKDARAMQEKHRYQLALKDYADVASWVQKYGNREH